MRLFTLALFVAAALLFYATPALAYAARCGDRAPELAGYDVLSRQSVALEDYRGRWVLVDFWATWCGFCVEELPNFVAATKPYRERGELALFSVAMEEADGWEGLKRAIRRYGIDFPVLCDGGGFRTIAAQEWGVTGIPASFLINPQGVIVANELRGEKLAATLDYYLNTPRPVIAFDSSYHFNPDGTISILAEISNPGREPLRLTLYSSVLEYLHEGDDPAAKIVSDRWLDTGEPLSAEAAIGELDEGQWEFILTPGADWDSLNYHLLALVPGTGTAEQDYADGIWLECGSRQILLMQLVWDGENYWRRPTPGAPLQEYETIEDYGD